MKALLLLPLLALAHAALPEISMDAMQLIAYNGYVGEEHTVTTNDSYLLTVHRIPCGRHMDGCPSGRPVVFLQHGLLCSSTNWLTNLPTESAAYILADAGFDVWMGNFRGNFYSSKKANPNESNKEFWAFSWDEMALQDLPAMIDHALHISGQSSLYYMGHSEGTMTPFALTSWTHAYDQKIRAIYALGPVATVNHISGFLEIIAKWRGPIDFLLKAMGMDQFLPESWLTKLAAETICSVGITDRLVCENILFLIAGPNTSQMNQTRVPIYIAHTPSGTSTQNIMHFAQGVVDTGKFQKYDYGNQTKLPNNQQMYHSYDLTQIAVPVYLFYGSKDVLADPTDVKDTLFPRIKTIKGKYEFDFNHLDFIWGLNAAKDVYSKVLGLMRADLDARAAS